jgi:hypothetical protein
MRQNKRLYAAKPNAACSKISGRMQGRKNFSINSMQGENTFSISKMRGENIFSTNSSTQFYAVSTNSINGRIRCPPWKTNPPDKGGRSEYALKKTTHATSTKNLTDIESTSTFEGFVTWLGKLPTHFERLCHSSPGAAKACVSALSVPQILHSMIYTSTNPHRPNEPKPKKRNPPTTKKNGKKHHAIFSAKAEKMPPIRGLA